MNVPVRDLKEWPRQSFLVSRRVTNEKIRIALWGSYKRLVRRQTLAMSAELGELLSQQEKEVENQQVQWTKEIRRYRTE